MLFNPHDHNVPSVLIPIEALPKRTGQAVETAISWKLFVSELSNAHVVAEAIVCIGEDVEAAHNDTNVPKPNVPQQLTPHVHSVPSVFIAAAAFLPKDTCFHVVAAPIT